jgi:hypothetical protein
MQEKQYKQVIVILEAQNLMLENINKKLQLENKELKEKFSLYGVGSSNNIDYKKGLELAIKYISTTVSSMEQSKESNDYIVKLQDFIDEHKLY